MDQAVIKYYRQILSEGFRFVGTVDNPTIVLDAVGENVRICDHVGTDSLQMFIKVKDDTISDIKYMCMCDPTTNVAVEILCRLALGKPLASLASITPESFSTVLGGGDEDLHKKAKGLMELVHIGLERFKTASISTQ